MILKDCSPIIVADLAKAKFGGRSANKIKDCLDWLKELSKNVNANDFLFVLSDNKSDPEPIVYTDAHGEWWVGRYIGTLSFKGIQVEIQPRFGLQFIAEQLPINKFALVDIEAEQLSGKSPFHFLQMLMWIKLLSQAAKHSLPVTKRREVHESTSIRGRIDIRRTVKIRSKSEHLVASILEEKVLFNSLSICIAVAFRKIQQWYPTLNLHHKLPAIQSMRLQQILDAVPRNQSLPLERDLKRIRYSSITKKYKPLLELSLQIIKGRNIDFKNEETNFSKGMLLDVAELWEVFVLGVLRDVYRGKLDVVHGTTGEGDYLLTSSTSGRYLAKLLPDFLMKTFNNEEVKVIADAKYKRLGDAPWLSPKREDLYQMSAYISRYQLDPQSAVNSLLIYPEWEKESSSIVNDSPWMLNTGSSVSFIALPIEHEKAVLAWIKAVF